MFSPWMDEAACRGQEDLFDAVALEWDPRSREAHSLAPVERASQKSAYDEAVAACLKVCAQCPVLTQCRDWVEATPLRVYGVVGGLAPDDRHTPTLTAVDDTTTRSPINTELVLFLHDQGIPVSMIAKETHRSERSIRRVIAQQEMTHVSESSQVDMPRYSALAIPADYRSGDYLLIDVPRHVIAVPHPEPTEHFPQPPEPTVLGKLPAATVPLNPDSVSGIAAAILDVLADGQSHSRDELIAAATAVIPEELALREWAVGVSTATETPALRIMRATATQVPHAERVSRGAHRRATTYLAWMERTRGWVRHRAGHFLAAGDVLLAWHAHRASTTWVKVSA